MLKDTIDFEYAINAVKQKIDLNIIPQDNIMNSNSMNESFKSIENSLNKLYENSRYLEDSIDYCKTFLSLKIDDYTTDIKSTLRSIEDIRDINKNMAYIEYTVPFIENKSVMSDRDGKSISSSIVKNDMLIIGNKSENTIEFNSCFRKSDNMPYSENIDEIKTEPYRAIYIEEKIANGGIVETITMTLKEPTEINYLDIQTTNCDIKNLRYVYLNGIEDYIEYDTGITPNKIVASIKFDLVCKRYDISTYQLDKDKITDSLWNKIKEYEYNLLTGVTSKLEAEAIISRVSSKGEEVFVTEIPNTDKILEKVMYTYMFGIDSVNIKKIEQEYDSCFISDSINVGTLSEKEYLQLNTAQYADENCTVEYSILDGDIEVPIIPIGHKHIENEKIFASLNLRFNQDESLFTVIKKDGMTVKISLEDAKAQSMGRYSADYTPALEYNYTPINSTIRVKAIIRRYGATETTPYIKNIKIRKYGGELLWMEQL
jgi:hypothetical protein